MSKTLTSLLHAVFLRNFPLKLIALFLTLALYIWVSVDREVVVTRYAPLRVITPEDKVLVSDPPSRVGVTVRGRWSELNRLDAEELGPVTVELDAEPREGLVPLSSDLVRTPPGLRVTGIEPNFIRYELEREVRRRVPVRAKLVGSPAEGFETSNVHVSPQTVELRGPASALADIRSVTTHPIELSGRTAGFDKRTRLELDSPHVEYNLNEAITVSVDVTTQEMERTFTDVPVEAVNTAMTTRVSPRTVEVTLRGPKSIVEAMKKSELRGSLDMRAEDDKPPALWEKEVQIRGVPPEARVLSKQPPTFRVRTLPRGGTGQN